MYRPRPHAVTQFDNEMVKDLLAMKRAGEFQDIWIDGGRVSILGNDQLAGIEYPRSMGPRAVADLIDEWKRRSTFVRFPPKSELAKQRMKGRIWR